MRDKELDVPGAAEKVLADGQLLREVMDGLKSKEETYRYNCSRVLTLISEKHGKVLYPHWEYFAGFLSSNNTYWKLSALMIIANLTAVDTEGKFEKMFDSYYQLLDDRSMITAVYTARSSGRIARAKPALEAGITEKLLNIDGTHYDQDRKDLIKSGAIEAFSEYYEKSADKDRIVEFVRKQVDSSSPKTRKMAREFLERVRV